MAKLSSTIIDGFISSAKRTGKTILKRGVEIPEIVEDFISGFAGTGWKIWKRAGKWVLEIDNLVIRKTMTVFELLTQKVRSVKGAISITQANGRISSVTIMDTEVLLSLEDEMSFTEYDFIVCQVFSGEQKYYHVEIERIENGVIHIPITEFESDEFGEILKSATPEPGDDIIQFGNSSRAEEYKGRHSAIYLHTDESGQPAIDLLEGIYSKDWSNCITTRIGGAIPGTEDKRGFYTVNGMIKAVDAGGSTMYYINPDGEASFAQNAALFKPDKSGHIAGGAIKWEWDSKLNKFVTTMGDVILTWNNLDEDSKQNLKGEAGISIVWKGEFLEAPANPQNGWAYKNILDKVSYVYESGNWNIMTIDGINGLDGHSLFATYNDSLTMPEKPTGDGTTNGWHTKINDTSIWMSQKVGFDPFSGEWSDPIKIKGQDANLLPWVEEWDNNKTLIAGDYLISPKLFTGENSGTPDEPILTGIAMGKNCIKIDGIWRTGIFAVVNNVPVFELDPTTKVYKFTGEVNATSGVFNNVTIIGSIRSPFKIPVDNSIPITSDSVFFERPGGSRLFNLSWDISQSGRKVTLSNRIEESESTNTAIIYAPPGKYFFENGKKYGGIKMSKSVIELLGLADENTFYGWVVLSRHHIDGVYFYGKPLGVIAMGQVVGREINPSFAYKTMNSTVGSNTEMRLERRSPGVYRIYFPQNWFSGTTTYMVDLTAIALPGTTAPVGVNLASRGEGYFEVMTSIGSTPSDGAFFFKLTNYNSWDFDTVDY